MPRSVNQGDFLEIEALSAFQDSAVHEQKRQLNKVTRLLCNLCKVINGAGLEGINKAVFESMPELNTWWKKYQEENRIRLEREQKSREKQIIERALAKLSPRERRLLGVKKGFRQ